MKTRPPQTTIVDSSASAATSGVLRYFVTHKTAGNLLLIALFVLGLTAAQKIRAQFFPDVVFESLSVSVAWPGAAPEEVNDALVARLEPVLRAVDGVEAVVATSRENAASISIDFVPSWDMAAALDDVNAAIDTITDLPEDIETPVVRRSRFHDRVTDVVISGSVSLNVLDQYAREFTNVLFRRGVSQTTTRGLTDPIIQIDANPAALQRHGVTLQQLASAIRSETQAPPVGDIDEGAARIRTLATRENASAIADITIRSTVDGSRLQVSDVANVYEEGLDRERAYFVDGSPAVVIQVDRDSDGNTIQLHQATTRAVAEFAQTLPANVNIALARTRAQAISDRLDILIRNGLSGLAIVLVLLFLFLSSRTAFWVAAGIPAAMLGSIALMYVGGVTINMVSLFGLIICLGIVVDDAIVVGEHTDHLARQGYSPADAATLAAKRMAAPVLAATVTTIIAFSGLMLIGGRFGALIVDLPITVCMVLAVSLVEAFIILPGHMRHSLSSHNAHSILDAPSRAVNRGLDWFTNTLFRPFIATTLKIRYPLVAGGILLFVFSLALFLDNKVYWRFFSAPERGTISANISMLSGATRADTLAQLNAMNLAMKKLNDKYAQEHGLAPVKHAIMSVGGTSGRGLSNAKSKTPDMLGSFSIELIDPDLRPYSAFDFIGEWRDSIQRTPLLDQLVLRGHRSGPGGDAIHVRLTGTDTQVIKNASEYIQQQLRRLDGVSAVEDDLSYDKPERVLSVTARGEALGFSTASVAAALREQLEGIDAVNLARNSRSVDVVVRLQEAATGASFLQETTIALPDGGYIPLSQVADFEEQQGFASIRREDGQQVVNVTGDVSDNTVQSDLIQQQLRDVILVQAESLFDIKTTQRGLAEQEREFLSDAALGFILCMIGIFFTLCWIFASWSKPLLILLMIPFGFVGAIWGHYWHGLPLSMFSVVGLIGMAGIIINDSIVLITRVAERARTQDVRSAIVDGTSDRLRAVILTTLTTVGGLTPLLFEQSRQALFLKPTVVTLAYGLGFGVFIILVLTPAVLAIHEDFRSSWRSARRAPAVWGRYRRQRRLASKQVTS